MAPSPGKTVALTQPRTAPAKFESPDSISSSGKRVQSSTESSKSSSSILAFRHLISRLARDVPREHFLSTYSGGAPMMYDLPIKKHEDTGSTSSRRTVLKSLPFLGPAFLAQRTISQQ